MMKPRQIFNTQPKRIRINGEWFELGTITLIGTSKWTIRDPRDRMVGQVFGNTKLEVEI